MTINMQVQSREWGINDFHGAINASDIKELTRNELLVLARARASAMHRRPGSHIVNLALTARELGITPGRAKKAFNNLTAKGYINWTRTPYGETVYDFFSAPKEA